jgi:hypothetical protein
VVVDRVDDVELLEDVLDVPLDGLGAEVQAVADALVRAAFRD